MEKYSKIVQIRWSDIDQNRHLRHSVYYDYGAMLRISYLSEQGLTTEKFEELKIGPIIFREEAIFRRELKLDDTLTIDAEIIKSTKDFSRYSVRHNFIKEDGTVAAIINLDMAWMDIEKRKLAAPGSFIMNVFDKLPRSEDFQWMETAKKI